MPAPGHIITRPAHAKLNLSLSIGPPEPAGSVHNGRDVSGYHRIASWFACIDLADELSITRKADGDLTTYDIRWAPDAPRQTPIDWSLSVDLASRAHFALEKHVGRLLPIDSTLTKRIPVGAGLGGGSSDAAAMLVALNQLFDLTLPPDTLRAIAATVGSDVPFFIDDETSATAHPAPRSALVTDFGDTIERIDTPDADILLIIPPFSCDTRAVYKAFDEHLDQRVRAKKRELSLRDGDAAADRYHPQPARDDLIRRRIDKANRAGAIDADTLFNDLFLPAASIEPRLGPLAAAISRATRESAHLTGSGSALFLLSRPAHARNEKRLAKVQGVLDSQPKTDDNLPTVLSSRLTQYAPPIA